MLHNWKPSERRTAIWHRIATTATTMHRGTKSQTNISHNFRRAYLHPNISENACKLSKERESTGLLVGPWGATPLPEGPWKLIPSSLQPPSESENSLQRPDYLLSLQLLFHQLSSPPLPYVYFKLIVAFWVMTPCSLVTDYKRRGGTCCLHLQGRLETLPAAYKTTQCNKPADHNLKFKHSLFRKKNNNSETYAETERMLEGQSVS